MKPGGEIPSSAISLGSWVNLGKSLNLFACHAINKMETAHSWLVSHLFRPVNYKSQLVSELRQLNSLMQ